MKRLVLTIKLILLTFLVILILGQIRTLSGLSGKKSLVTNRQTELSKLKNEHEMLRRKEEETKTKEYVEREARNKLGMGKVGETIILLPDEYSTISGKITPSSADFRPIWQQWLELFF